MSAADALVQAILAAPDDDTPRLVYADYLQEHGGVRGSIRAKLIRGQCELERLAFDDPRKSPLWLLCSQLEDRCRQALADLPSDAEPGWHQHCNFDRGMPVYYAGTTAQSVTAAVPPGLPAEVTVSVEFFPYGDSAGALADWFGSARAVADWFDRAAWSPDASRVVHIRVSCEESCVGPEHLGPVLAGRFPRLVTLALGGCGLTDVDVRPLTAGVGFEHLRTLELARNGLTAGGLVGLASGPLGGRLRSVSATGNPGAADPAALAAWLMCPALRQLWLLSDMRFEFDRPTDGPLRIRVVPDEIPF